jgi:short-subunit dehydrogenase
VVTGGSDGIGFEMCKQLAEQGFNICIVSRTMTKIENCLSQIKLLYSVETRAIQADLGKLNSLEAYNELVKEHLGDIDVGVLALNAGNIHIGPVDLLTDSQFECMYNIFALSVAYFTKSMLNTLMGRENRSAIIITSSGIRNIPMPGVQSYAATKAFASNFGIALSYEVRHKIDVMVWEAGSTETNMVKDVDKGCCSMTAQRAVAKMLTQLGKTNLTSGNMGHEMQNWTSAFFPLGLLGSKIADQVRQEHQSGKYTKAE